MPTKTNLNNKRQAIFNTLAVIVIGIAAITTWFIQHQKINDLSKANALLSAQTSQLASAEKQILAVSKAYCIGANIKCQPTILKQLEQDASVNIGPRDLLVSKDTESTWRVVLGANKGELCSIGADAPGLGSNCK